MSKQAEQAFIRSFLSTLSSQAVVYPDDYQQPPENSLTKVPVLPIVLPPPTKRRKVDTEGNSSNPISLVFKLAKPPTTYKLDVRPTDSVASIKTQLATEHVAPPADAQRLVFKGKALADGKLLKEYNLSDGDTINLMIKPGVNWDPAAQTTSSPGIQTSHVPSVPSSKLPSSSSNMSASLEPKPTAMTAARRHQRIPSVVLSPSSSADVADSTEKPLEITLNLDETPSPTGDALSSYHQVLANPDFWLRLRTFLGSEFTSEADRIQAFEEFLLVSKGSLTAHEIAKIRDTVGIVGMAGH